jgi:membrane protein YdbS with pleckstrin-like domain
MSTSAVSLTEVAVLVLVLVLVMVLVLVLAVRFRDHRQDVQVTHGMLDTIP